MTAPRRRITDLNDGPTLAVSLACAFAKIATAYGARLEGIEDDVNEHTDFWFAVAREVLDANP
jgi:hypothetical protein